MEKKRKRRIQWVPFFIGIGIAIAGIFAYLNEKSEWFTYLMELKTVDIRFLSRGEIPAGEEVVLAVIDEKSLAREGNWIWPRSKIAKLVTNLDEAGARVIAFDIVFAEPDKNDDLIINTIDEINRDIGTLGVESPELNEYFNLLKMRADNDKLLAEAMKKARARIVLGYFFQMEKKNALHLTKAAIKGLKKNIYGSYYKFQHFAPGVEPDSAYAVSGIRKAYYPQANIDSISESGFSCGYFNMIPESDGAVRWIPSVIQYDKELYAPLSLMALSAYKNGDLSIKFDETGMASLAVGDLFVPVDSTGHININYRGKPKTFPHISITDILNKNFKPDQFKNKIVLVGATAIGIYDHRVTPFDEVFPGLEIHANTIDNILQGDFLYKPFWIDFFTVIIMLSVGIVFGIVLPRFGVVTGFILASIIFFGYIIICFLAFSSNGWILNIIFPSIITILVYLTITIFQYFSEYRQKKFIKNAFSTYLAPSVVNLLLESPEKLVLGGEEREITAFFSDVQGFTSISEQLSPNELVELLNEFLTEMTNIILKHRGTVDKFEGDAIIAFFGAPIDLENQALAAVEASLEMQEKLVEMRREWAEKGKAQLKMRIGLCTGPAVVGNMGSKSRMDYTMMGDTVNTAARLEGVNKIYQTYSLIDEKTVRKIDSSEILVREIDNINVVGKHESITIYELVGRKNGDRTREHLVEVYKKGLDAFRNMDFQSAIEFFQHVLEEDETDGPSITMLKRCEEFIENPPDENWDRAYHMRTK